MDNPRVRAVLDAAERLIDQGHDEASIRAVAQEAGLGTSTIYEYFDSRSHVFAATLDRWIRANAVGPAEVDGDLDQVVAALVARRIASAKKHPRFVVLAAQLTLGREGDRAIRAGFADMVATLASGLKSDELALEPREAALLVAAGIEGAVLAAVEERPHYLDDPAFANELGAALVAAISKSPKPLPLTRAKSNETRQWTVRRPQREIRRTPRQERARVLVDAIFRGAERVIERSGVQAASTPSIAEAAGVSIGSLYQYFRDREGVLGGVIDWWIEHDLGLIRRELEAAKDAPFDEFFVNGMRKMHALNVRALGVYRAIFSLLPRLGRYPAAQEFLSRGTQEVTAVLAQRSDAAHLDAALTCFVTGYVWVAWVRRFIASEADFFASKAFEEALYRFGRSVTFRRRIFMDDDA